MDHIYPLIRGGDNHPSNLQALQTKINRGVKRTGVQMHHTVPYGDVVSFHNIKVPKMTSNECQHHSKLMQAINTNQLGKGASPEA